MQVVENWSDIEGELLSHRPNSVAQGFVELRIRVKKIKDVHGFRNLIDGSEGSTIEVNAPEDLVRDVDLTKGKTVRCRVRRAGPHNIFVHPEHFSLE